MKATELFTYLMECDPKEIGPKLQSTLALSQLLTKKHHNVHTEFFHASHKYSRTFDAKRTYHYDVKVTGRNKEGRAMEYVRIKIARYVYGKTQEDETMFIRFGHKTPERMFNPTIDLHLKQ